MATIDSYSSSYGDTTTLLIAGGSYHVGAGQAFTLAQNTSLTSASFSLSPGGSPSGTIYAKLYAATGSVGSTATPTGSALASGSINANTVSGKADYEITFSSPYVAGSGNYVVTCEYGDGNTNHYIQIYYDNSSPAHAGNYCDTVTGASWVASSTKDLVFILTGTLLKTNSFGYIF